MRKVALVGAGVTKFGVRKASYRDLIWEAGKACFDSIPAVKPKDLDGLVVGSVMPERTAFQSHISSLAAEALGIRPSTLSARTEHMCASGTVGIRYAYAFIAAGLADLVMVLGVEKLNQPTGDEAILNMGTGVDREWEAAFGLTAPPCFALAAQRHMAEYGTTEEQLAQVGVKNHTHASRNPNAHFNKGATLDQVLCSRMISTPLRLFMCSPITDGAAAVVLASEERARALTDTPVWIRGTGQALDGFQLTSLHEDYAHWPALKRAGAVGVPHGRHRARRRRSRRGARLLRDRRDDRLRGARLLQEGRGGAVRGRRPERLRRRRRRQPARRADRLRPPARRHRRGPGRRGLRPAARRGRRAPGARCRRSASPTTTAGWASTS